MTTNRTRRGHLDCVNWMRCLPLISGMVMVVTAVVVMIKLLVCCVSLVAMRRMALGANMRMPTVMVERWKNPTSDHVGDERDASCQTLHDRGNRLGGWGSQTL
ncbi:MAG: hypothetical protein ACR2NZ_15200 [Rubripirellula sp.]